MALVVALLLGGAVEAAAGVGSDGNEVCAAGGAGAQAGVPQPSGGGVADGLTSPSVCMQGFLRSSAQCKDLFCESYWFFTSCSTHFDLCMLNTQWAFELCKLEAEG